MSKKQDGIRARIAELDTLAKRQAEIEAEAAALLADETAALESGDSSEATLARLSAQAARRMTLERMAPAVTARAAALMLEVKADLKAAAGELINTLHERHRKVAAALIEKLTALGIDARTAESAARAAEPVRAVEAEIHRIGHAVEYSQPADVLAALDALSR